MRDPGAAALPLVRETAQSRLVGGEDAEKAVDDGHEEAPYRLRNVEEDERGRITNGGKDGAGDLRAKGWNIRHLDRYVGDRGRE